jgi:rhodanese-related sulfurtransferase
LTISTLQGELMGLFDTLKKALGRPAAPAEAPAHSPGATERELPTLEVTAAELLAELQDEALVPPLLLDCREDFERRMSFIPDSLHIAMNTIPVRLTELDRERRIVVYCAHGNRSYGVAGWLLGQGYRAVSLQGGIAAWRACGGTVGSALGRR